MKAKEKRPRIYCICGSSRFCANIAIIKWEIEKTGSIAIGMHLLPADYKNGQPDHQAEFEGVSNIMDELHLRKIDLADEVLVANIDGYIGERTAFEIKYAKSIGKPVNYYENK